MNFVRIISSFSHSFTLDVNDILFSVAFSQIEMHACTHAQSCLTLCDPIDCNLPGSSVYGESPGKNTGFDPNPGAEPVSLESPPLAGRFFPPCLLGFLINTHLSSLP